MLQKTKGIVLKSTNYSENSIVCQIFTENFGMQSFLIAGARKPKSKLKAGFFQALYPVDLIINYKEGNTLLRISEARQSPVLLDIPYNIVKSSMVIFLDEILYKVLREAHEDHLLFDFLYTSILWLDHATDNLANFHLVFLIRLSYLLGFGPTISSQRKPFFNLEEASFTTHLPPHPHVLQEPHTSLFYALLQTDYEHAAAIKMSSSDRQFLLKKILDYYRLHLTHFKEIKSLYILEEIFH